MNTSIIHSYKDLIVWQKSMDLVTEIYSLTENYPQSELYGLTSQMRRAAVSIPSNIAEGRKRSSRKEFGRFLSNAFGSSAELETQLMISQRLGPAKEGSLIGSFQLLNEIMRMLCTMLSKIKSYS